MCRKQSQKTGEPGGAGVRSTKPSCANPSCVRVSSSVLAAHLPPFRVFASPKSSWRGGGRADASPSLPADARRPIQLYGDRSRALPAVWGVCADCCLAPDEQSRSSLTAQLTRIRYRTAHPDPVQRMGVTVSTSHGHHPYTRHSSVAEAAEEALLGSSGAALPRPASIAARGNRRPHAWRRHQCSATPCRSRSVEVPWRTRASEREREFESV